MNEAALGRMCGGGRGALLGVSSRLAVVVVVVAAAYIRGTAAARADARLLLLVPAAARTGQADVAGDGIVGLELDLHGGSLGQSLGGHRWGSRKGAQLDDRRRDQDDNQGHEVFLGVRHVFQ